MWLRTCRWLLAALLCLRVGGRGWAVWPWVHRGHVSGSVSSQETPVCAERLGGFWVSHLCVCLYTCGSHVCLLNGDFKKNLNTRERFGRCWETDSPGRRNVNPLTGPGTPEQHCLLFLPAGVLDGQAASAQAHLGGGCVGSRGGRVGWSRPGEGGPQGT